VKETGPQGKKWKECVNWRQREDEGSLKAEVVRKRGRCGEE